MTGWADGNDTNEAAPANMQYAARGPLAAKMHDVMFSSDFLAGLSRLHCQPSLHPRDCQHAACPRCPRKALKT